MVNILFKVNVKNQKNTLILKQTLKTRNDTNYNLGRVLSLVREISSVLKDVIFIACISINIYLSFVRA